MKRNMKPLLVRAAMTLLVLMLTFLTFPSKAWAQTTMNAVPYIDADGNTAYCTNYSVLTGSDDYTEINSPGWYVVTNSNTDPNDNGGVDVSYPQGLTINGGEGDVNLILCDDAEMRIDVNENCVFAMQVNGNSFNIYGQIGGTGKLTTSTDNYYGIYAVSCDMTINGGTISASGGDYGIYAESCALTINGGTIDANGGSDGISSGAFTISSGTVNATGEGYNGISTLLDITINGGIIEAHGKSDGISCNEGNITISGGNVTADCTANNSSGIFCSEGDITISGGSVYATGKKAGIDADNKLIISDGYIEATGNDYGILASLDITISGGEVTAVGNNSGTGLYCYSGGITISGGTVQATGNSVGIFAGSEITISGGIINASGENSCGIMNSGGDITISGGSITATGADGFYANDGDIKLGWTNASDYITARSIIAMGKVMITEGKVFTDGTNTYSNKSESLEALKSQITLRPLVENYTLTAKKATINAGMADESTNYWTTFYCGDAGYVIDNSVEACAYTVTLSGSDIMLSKLGKSIPAKTAVVIIANSSDETVNAVNVTMTKSELSEFTGSNALRGLDMATSRTSLLSTYGADAILMLSNKNGHFGFHDVALTNIPAHKAFLPINDSPSAREFSIVFEGATGIEELETGRIEELQSDGAWYSLDGRRLAGQPTTKGVYVKNGKKVILK